MTVIEPVVGWVPLNLRDLWHYRDMLYFLIWRDIKVRYKQTVLGAGWAIAQPLCMMIIFSLVFGRFAKVPSDGVAYPLFALAGLIPWTYFAQGLAGAADSIVSNANLVKKVYFPRIIIPLAAVLGGLIDLAIGAVLLGGMLLVYGVTPGLNILILPLVLMFAIATVLGAGLWLSALNIQYRDVRYTLSYLIQLWMYATPVVYPASLLPEPWKTLLALNPMSGVVESFRWALLGTPISEHVIEVSVGTSVLLLVTGAFYFRRMEKTFADLA